MPGVPVDVGTGTTLTFATSGWTAQIMSARWSGITRAAVETTHMGSTPPGGDQIGGRTYMPPDLADPGELTLEVNFNPNTNPPINSVAETVTVTFPLAAGDLTPASWAATGFMTGFDINDPLEDRMTATVTVKLSGNITMTDST